MFEYFVSYLTNFDRMWSDNLKLNLSKFFQIGIMWLFLFD